MAGIDPKFYYLTLGLLALCTLVGLVVAYRLQREVNEDLVAPSERELLGPLEKAYYSGLMREEEFLRIQQSMARQKGEEPVPAAKPSKTRTKPEPVAESEATTEETDSTEGPVFPPTIMPPGDSAPGHEPG